MRRLIVGAVGVALALSACGRAAGYDENAEIPADAWPNLDGVTVIASDGFTGADCCEQQQTGGRMFQLKTSVAAEDAIEMVGSGLIEAGWQTSRCNHPTVCLHDDGMAAVLLKPDFAERKRGVEVTVWLNRDP